MRIVTVCVLDAAAEKLESELNKPEVDALIKQKLEEVMRKGDQSAHNHILIFCDSDV